MTKKLDIGLRLRNAKEKVHITTHVRCEKNLQTNYLDWKYSEKVKDFIKTYIQQFPEIDEYFIWLDENEKQAQNYGQKVQFDKITDLFPWIETDEE